MANHIDLHLHTNVSDGSDTVLELYDKVKMSGLSIFSVTDHDMLDGTLEMEQLVAEIAENLEHAKKINVQTLVEAENDTSWGKVGLFDEDELLDRLEIYISELKKNGDTTLEVEEIEKRIEQRRKVVEEKINRLNPNGLEMLKRHREEIEEHIKSEHPDYYEQIMAIRKELK